MADDGGVAGSRAVTGYRAGDSGVSDVCRAQRRFAVANRRGAVGRSPPVRGDRRAERRPPDAGRDGVQLRRVPAVGVGADHAAGHGAAQPGTRCRAGTAGTGGERQFGGVGDRRPGSAGVHVRHHAPRLREDGVGDRRPAGGRRAEHLGRPAAAQSHAAAARGTDLDAAAGKLGAGTEPDRQPDRPGTRRRRSENPEREAHEGRPRAAGHHHDGAQAARPGAAPGASAAAGRALLCRSQASRGVDLPAGRVGRHAPEATHRRPTRPWSRSASTRTTTRSWSTWRPPAGSRCWPPRRSRCRCSGRSPWSWRPGWRRAGGGDARRLRRGAAGPVRPGDAERTARTWRAPSRTWRAGRPTSRRSSTGAASRYARPGPTQMTNWRLSRGRMSC